MANNARLAPRISSAPSDSPPFVKVMTTFYPSQQQILPLEYETNNIFSRHGPRAEGKDFSSEMPSETIQPPSERRISEHKNSREAFLPQIYSQVSVPFRAPTLCLLFFQFSPFFFSSSFVRTCWTFLLTICCVSQNFLFFLPFNAKIFQLFFASTSYFCF